MDKGVGAEVIDFYFVNTPAVVDDEKGVLSAGVYKKTDAVRLKIRPGAGDYDPWHRAVDFRHSTFQAI